MNYTQQHLDETRQIIEQLNPETIERMVILLHETRARGGRLFILSPFPFPPRDLIMLPILPLLIG